MNDHDCLKGCASKHTQERIHADNCDGFAGTICDMKISHFAVLLSDDMS